MVAFKAIALLLLLTSSLSLAGYLSGRHLRVGYVENSPLVFTETVEKMNQTETVLHGFGILLLEWMARRANFTFSMVPLDYTERFNGLPKEFANKNLHMGLANWGLSHGRNLIAHYVYPIIYDDYTFLIPFPKNDANIWSVFLPFTVTVWVCFLVSAATMVFLLKFVATAKLWIFGPGEDDSFATLSGASSYVIGVATNQGATCFSKARTVRLAAGVWCLAALVVINAYSGSLITFMTVPRINPLVNSVRELGNRSDPQILTPGESFIRIQFEESPLYRDLRDNVDSSEDICGWINEKGFDDCLTMVRKGRHVMAIETSMSRIILDTEFRRSRTCQLTVIEQQFEPGYGSAVIPLNSTHEFRNAIDVLIMETIQLGLLERWKEMFRPQRNFCKDFRNYNQQTLRRLSLTDFVSCFIAFGFLLGLSFLAFVYERMTKVFKTT